MPVLNFPNSLKKRFDQSHPVSGKATQKGQRELREGGREDTSHDFPERYQWKKSEEVLVAMDDSYTILCLLPLTLLPFEQREGTRVRVRKEVLLYLSLLGFEACSKHACGYTQIGSCWDCQSVVGMGDGGGT